MRIAILATENLSVRFRSLTYIVDAIMKAGHELVWLDQRLVGPSEPMQNNIINYRKAPIHIDRAFHWMRVADPTTLRRTLGLLESSRISFLNNADAIRTSSNKLLAAAAFKLAQISHPETQLYGQLSFDEIAQRLDVPFIVKPINGFGGSQVSLVSNEVELSEATSSNQGGDYWLVQRFIPQIAGGDLRIVLLGNEVLDSYGRVGSASNPIITNTTLGGARIKRSANSEQIELAFKTLAAVGLDWGAVDMVETPQGNAVIETNAAPRLAGAKGVYVAQRITNYLASF